MPRPESFAKAIQGDQSRHSKAPRKGSFYLELKPFKKAATARPPEEVRPEMKRFRKQSDRMRREEPEPPLALEGGLPDGRKFPGFHNTWDHTNFSVIPSVPLKASKDFPGMERKRKKSGRMRNRNRSTQRLKNERAEEKEKKRMELLLKDKKKDTQVEVLYPPYDPFAKGRKGQNGGQAVVIYQRHNRRDYVYPQTGNTYRFEQIAFSRNCEASVNIVQSKRSLSEPRKNAPKELFIAKRRNRLQVEPHKMTSTQSDFHSAYDILKQSSACVEYNKFEKGSSSFTRIIYQDPLRNSKIGRNFVCGFDTEDGSESTNRTKVRLKQAAEKKLDLHREMMRAEKTSKKKFWESIERSLNYRCALAQMLSSQSFISHNNSSKFFSATESSTGRSANFYVRESVIEKISSYQGFQRFVTLNQTESRKKSENITQTSNEAYQKMKTLLNSFLIKEDEEERETLLHAPFEVGFNFRSASDSTIQTDFAPLSIAENLPHHPSVSDKLSLLESNLKSSDASSDLEMLMAKMSEEIRRCSRFIGSLKRFEKKELSAKLSVSDSKVALNKNAESITENIFPILGGLIREQAVFPVSFRQSKDHVHTLTDNWPEKNKPQIHFEVTEERSHKLRKEPSPTIHSQKSENLQRQGSNTSLLSFAVESTPSKETLFSKKAVKKPEDLLYCDDCKRLKEKIRRLEKELEKVEKRMPFYPAEYQNSIKYCLESLKATSETVLKRLRSCANLRYLDSQSKKYCSSDSRRSKRPLSAPNTAVHKSTKQRLCLRPSNSDYDLQVGMEITMENVDPVTGKKLHPEVSEDCQQEGNIQCKIYKDKDAPVLVLDTDFAYNPRTGMLFKGKDDNCGPSQSKDFMVPLEDCTRSPSAFNLVKGSVSAYECIPGEKNVFAEEPSQEEKLISSREASTSGSFKDDVSLSPKECTSPKSLSPEKSDSQCIRTVELLSRKSKTDESVRKARGSNKDLEKCDSDSQKMEKSVSDFEKIYRSIIEIKNMSKSETDTVKSCKDEEKSRMSKKDEVKAKKKAKDEEDSRKKYEADLKGREKSEAELKKRDKSEAELKKRDKSEAELKKRDKSEAELKKRDKSEAKLKKRDKSETELKKKEKSEVKLKKRDKSETELKKKEKSEAKLKKRDKSEVELKKKEKSEAELKKRDKSEVELNSLVSNELKDSCKSLSSGKNSIKKMTSRIPTRRKTTPSGSRSAGCSSSRKNSELSFASTLGSSVVECRAVPAISKISLKNSRLKNSDEKVLHRKEADPKDFDKTTQTFKDSKWSAKEHRPKTVNVGIQVKRPVENHGVQTMATKNEIVHTRSSIYSSERSHSPSETSSGLKDVFSAKRVATPATVNVAMQVERGNSRNSRRPTANVGLQTNLPTEESLKYKNDLQIQKKVNMAIAELCFHLTDRKEKQKV